jgi:hypothetical protein
MTDVDPTAADPRDALPGLDARMEATGESGQHAFGHLAKPFLLTVLDHNDDAVWVGAVYAVPQAGDTLAVYDDETVPLCRVDEVHWAYGQRGPAATVRVVPCDDEAESDKDLLD